MKKGQFAVLIALIMAFGIGITCLVYVKLDKNNHENGSVEEPINNQNGQMDSTNNSNGEKQKDGKSDANNNTQNNNKVENSDTLVWKMVVSNLNGAKVYKKNGYGNIESVNNTLTQGITIDIVGDLYYDENYYGMTFSDFGDLKGKYYLQYKCDTKDELGNKNNCYVKYSDLTLSKFTNGFNKEYAFANSKKALLTDSVDVYEGPGLMFKKAKAKVSKYIVIDILYHYNLNDWVYIDNNGVKGWAYIAGYRDIDYHYNGLYVNNSIAIGKALNNAKIITRKSTKVYDENGNIIDEIPSNTTLTHNLSFVNYYGVKYNGKQGYIKLNSNERACNVGYDDLKNCDFEIEGGHVGP